jgi:acyl carrier protein phosphodiesterase
MNHLGHLVLAGSSEGLRLGAFLGDHVKGRLTGHELPESWLAGIRLHRHVDSLVDSCPEVRAFVSSLQPPLRRYGGIFVDVLFDHMLARQWADFGPCPLPEFAVGIDLMLERHDQRLPARLRRFSRWARERSLWSRYGDRAMIDSIFQGLAWRHDRPSPLGRGLEVLDAHEGEIEGLFLEVFPKIRVRADEWRTNYSSISSM